MLNDGFGVERCVGVARHRAERPSCEHSPALGVDNLCPPCRAEMKETETRTARHGDEPVRPSAALFSLHPLSLSCWGGARRR